MDQYKEHPNSYSVHPLPIFSAGGGGGVDPVTKFSKRAGLTRSQFWEGVSGKEGVTFFSGGCSFFIKDKLKFEIFKVKKNFINKMSFSVVTNNVNWKILNKNSINFKRWDGVKDEKF